MGGIGQICVDLPVTASEITDIVWASLLAYLWYEVFQVDFTIIP